MRAAGSSANYEYHLYDKSRKRYVKDDIIELPGVTSVIGATLAKPVIADWTYYKTVDYIAGLVDWAIEVGFTDQENDMAIIDYLSYGDALREILKHYRMRTEDTTEDSSVRGRSFHNDFERLALASLEIDPKEATRQATKLARGFSDQKKAIGQWWLDLQPEVIAAERRVKSLEHGFMGTLDLLWRDMNGFLVITDLKNRAEDKEVYESDLIQVQAYKIAVEETLGLPVDRSTVLVAREDGTYYEETSHVNPNAFLDLLAVYEEMKRTEKFRKLNRKEVKTVG